VVKNSKNQQFLDCSLQALPPPSAKPKNEHMNDFSEKIVSRGIFTTR
jgi:hypothetical protein